MYEDELIGKNAFVVKKSKVHAGNVIKEFRELEDYTNLSPNIKTTFYLKLWEAGEEIAFGREDINRKVFLSHQEAEDSIQLSRQKDINSINLFHNGKDWTARIPETCTYGDTPEQALHAIRGYIDRKCTKT